MHLLRLSEKFLRCQWTSPTGYQEAPFWPISCFACRPNHGWSVARTPFRTVSLGSTLAIRLHSKPPRLVVQRMLAELLPCRFLHATRKKSAPGPTTLCAPNRAHQRRSDEPCGTRPPDAARHPLPASSADAQTK